MKIIKLAVLALFALTFAHHSAPAAEAQSTIKGTWTASDRYDKDDKDEKIKDGKIQLNFTRRTERNGVNNHGSSYPISELQGLSPDQINSANSSVSFRLVREAGTIECRGVFTNGRGTGEFTFTPNSSFVDGMKSRGYATLSDERLFTSATLNLTLAFVDDLKSAGFGDLTIDDIFKARIFNITPQFMSEMKATGFPNLEMEDLVKARIFKIDADFVRQVTEMGFAKDSLEGLVKLRIFKITPEFLREMKTLNFPNLTPEEAVNLRIFKVTPEFIKELQSLGFNRLSVEEATKFRIFKIDSEFIRKAKAENPNITVEELVRMKIHAPRVRVDREQ